MMALAMKTCFFTNFPDEHFMLDHHPEHREVVLAAGFSDPGFKFWNVVGEIMAARARRRHATRPLRVPGRAVCERLNSRGFARGVRKNATPSNSR